MQITKELFIQNFKNLSNSDPEIKNKANKILMLFLNNPQTWIISRVLMSNQQLLDQEQNQFQFLGAHLLNQKIRINFHLLNQSQKHQIREFVLDQITKKLKKILKATLKKLCSSTAIIMIYTLQNQWTIYLKNLIEFMKTSQQHLIAGLYILTQIPQQLKQSTFDRSQQNNLKQIILQPIQQISSIFSNCLNLKIKLITHVTIQSILQWSLFNAKFLKTTLFSLLLQIQIPQQNQNQFGQIISQIISRSDIADSTCQFTQCFVKWTQIQQRNINNLCKWLINMDEKYNIYVYTQIIISFMMNYSAYFMNRINNQGLTLIKIVLKLTNYKQYKISNKTYDFWLQWKQIIKNFKKHGQLQIINFGKQVFLQLFKIVLENCRIKSFQQWKYIENPQKEQMKQQNNEIQFTQFRQASSQILQSIYFAYKQNLMQNNVNQFYQILLNILNKKQANIQAHVSNVQLSIFAIKSIHQFINKNQNSIIKKYITFITSPQFPQSPISIYSGLQFISQMRSQIQSDANLINCVIPLIIKYMKVPQLQVFCSSTFSNLLNFKQIHELNSIAQLVIIYFESNIENFNDEVTIDNIINGIINFLNKLASKEIKSLLINRMISCIENYLKFFQSEQRKIMNKIKIMKSLFQVIQHLKQRQKQILVEHIYPFYLNSNQFINSILYNYWNLNQKMFYSLRNLYIAIIKIVKKKLTNFTPFLNIFLTIFESNPIKYYSSLHILSTLLSSLQKNNQMNLWLQSNLISLNKYCLKKISQSTQNIEFSKLYFLFQKNLIQYSPTIFQKEQNMIQIIQLSKWILTRFGQYGLTKQVLSFQFQFLKTSQLIKHHFLLNKFIFDIFTNVNPTIHVILINIFIEMYNIQGQYFKQLLTDFISTQFSNLDQKQKELIFKAFILYSKNKMIRQFKLLLHNLMNIYSNQQQGNLILQIEIKYNQVLKRLQCKYQQQIIVI